MDNKVTLRSRGLPSRGCNNCRAKKVRCDETKPLCERCRRAGSDGCTFRDEFERTWRWQNNKPSQKTVPERRNLVESQTTTTDSRIALLAPVNSQILERLQYDWSLDGEDAPGVSISWLRALPEMYAHARSCSLLASSIAALASASYGRRFNNAKALMEATEWCGKALLLLRETISSENSLSPTGDVMISVVLLGIYETFLDPSMSPNGSWMNHMGGATMLSKIRGHNEADERSANVEISAMIFRQMLHGCLMIGQAPSIPMKPVQQVLPVELKQIRSLTELVYGSALLFSMWKPLFGKVDNPSGLKYLSEIAISGLSLNESLEKWSKELPQTFAYSMESTTRKSHPEWLRSLLDGPWSPQHFHYYRSPVAEMLWRFYWVTRMILGQVLLYTNVVLRERRAPSNPVAVAQGDIERFLLSSIDRLCESCLTPLAATNPRGLKYCGIDQVPSLKGYLLLQILPTVGFCLDQVIIYEVDLSTRQSWVTTMRQFLQHELGFAKAAAEISPGQFTKLPIQLWGLGT